MPVLGMRAYASPHYEPLADSSPRTLFIAVDRPDMILQAAGGTIALHNSAKFWIVGESELLAAIDFGGDRTEVGWAGFPVADV